MNRFLYNLYCCIAWPLIRLVCPCRVSGRENIPSGAAIICSNHSSNFDPPMLAIYFGVKHKMHFMSKAELLDIPILGFLLKQAGVFPVHRGENTDIQAIRTAMKILKNGEKVMMFPQGTRVLEGEYIAAKTGAVRIASKLGVPVLPVYITSGGKAFKKSVMIIGKPYHVTAPADKSFEPAAAELLERINNLEPKN